MLRTLTIVAGCAQLPLWQSALQVTNDYDAVLMDMHGDGRAKSYSSHQV